MLCITKLLKDLWPLWWSFSPVKFPFCISICRKKEFSLFPLQVSKAYPVGTSEWKGEITVSGTWLNSLLEAFAGLPAMPSVQLAGQPLPCLPLCMALRLYFVWGDWEKNPQTSFEMLYIIKSRLGCHCFWLKEGASLNGIKEISSCLKSPFLCFSLTGRKV